MGGPGSGRWRRNPELEPLLKATSGDLPRSLLTPVVKIGEVTGVLISSTPKADMHTEYETFAVSLCSIVPREAELVTVIEYYPGANGSTPAWTTVPAQLKIYDPETQLALWQLLDTDKYEYLAPPLPADKHRLLTPLTEVYYAVVKNCGYSESRIELPVARVTTLAAVNIPGPKGLACYIECKLRPGVVLLSTEDKVYTLGFDAWFYPAQLLQFIEEAGL